MTDKYIQLRGVEVHNLQCVDLDIPRNELVLFCGVSGSGKTSLALDTLYAEGQRRYIESFSAYARQFLEQLDKPEAESIDGIPPAVAVTHRHSVRSSRSTVGSATEIDAYLRLLFARIGRTWCHECGRQVQRDQPQNVAERLDSLPEGTRYMVTFPMPLADDDNPETVSETLREDGFIRVVSGEDVVQLADQPLARPMPDNGSEIHVIVDRLAAGGASSQRVRDSLEMTFAKGGGRCVVFIAREDPGDPGGNDTGNGTSDYFSEKNGTIVTIQGRQWRKASFASRLECSDCDIEYPDPEPRLFSFNSPLGACPECEGFGNIVDVDMELVVPDPSKSLAEGAIAPWNTPSYSHELERLMAVADEANLPTKAPFSELTEQQRQIVLNGLPGSDCDGLHGFFARLEKRKYKMHLRVFLSRWKSHRPCPVCHGDRLRPESLATRVGDRNMAQIAHATIDQTVAFFENLELTEWEQQVGRMMLDQIRSRLGYLQQVGLGYLTLDRTLRTLSGGECERVSLTSALGSGLVNMLYVLDEPSVGLHPQDVEKLVEAVARLRDRGNTVVVVEHEESMIRRADHIIEFGPGAGRQGGRIVFEGTPQEMIDNETSMTGDYLAGRRGINSNKRRKTSHGWIRLAGARGNNLKNVTVEFPLGVLCVISGVSGAGKSTLTQHTLYGALCQRLRKEAPKPLHFGDVFGDGQIDDVLLVDQSPVGRSPRSNPVTYIKAFDEIRAVFAETLEARTHNYSAGHFSFNVDGGRCDACKGDGYMEIDMQFLANVYMKCSQCGGTRYRKEILDVTYRGRNIAEVLQMTVREAFTFFRGRPKVQARLKRLIDVGLDYLPLGQPAATLSGGEAQRLKLAGYLGAAKRARTLFILDEPTTGLHFHDVVQLLDCFEALLSVGHSLIVVEHNLQLLQAADYIIDLGPGAGGHGGQVVASGTPEQVCEIPESVTGGYLSPLLWRR